MKIKRISQEDKEKLKGKVSSIGSKLREIDSGIADNFRSLRKDNYLTYTD